MNKRIYGCIGKTTFETYQKAAKQARTSARRHDTQLTAYHCQVCNKYHVGTAAGKPINKRKFFFIEEDYVPQ
jgi:hypothetical protein